VITTSRLTKRYGDRIAVDDLTLCVRPGIVTGFLGPNGAGKSTTMRLIVGLEEPTSGLVMLDGRRYRDLDQPLRVIGTLLDANAIDPKRAAADHLDWLARSNDIDRRRVDAVLGLVGLADVAGHRVATYSLGMRQRLGLAAALLGDPETLMLDEPINGLDPDGILWLRNLLRSLAAEGRTVFLSSHLMSEMSQTADRLLVIGHGRLLADATTQDIVEQHSHTEVRVRATTRGDELELLIVDQGGVVRADGDGMIATGITSQRVGELAAMHGIALTELTARQASLEAAFIELTHDSTLRRAGAALTAPGAHR
jgi:ABC-2 type transport system ATP-binding protein